MIDESFQNYGKVPLNDWSAYECICINDAGFEKAINVSTKEMHEINYTKVSGLQHL